MLRAVVVLGALWNLRLSSGRGPGGDGDEEEGRLPPAPPAVLPGELRCDYSGQTTDLEPELLRALAEAGVSVWDETAAWLQLIRRASPMSAKESRP